MRFGSKFGASLDSAKELLELCKLLEMDVIGVSFHIGSGCFDTQKYTEAVSMCQEAFQIADGVGLPPMTFLDLGGGFPGNPKPNQSTTTVEGQTPSFEEFATVIEAALTKYFPASKHPNLQIIAEPGRYFATAWATLFAQVQGKREVRGKNGEKQFLYYINDGIYGSFNCIMFDHAHPVPIPLNDFLESDTTIKLSPDLYFRNNFVGRTISHAQFSTTPNRLSRGTIFGPTCDSMDVLIKDHPMRELHVGDTLVFEHMGAYTSAAATTFNGCKMPLVRYMRSERS